MKTIAVKLEQLTKSSKVTSPAYDQNEGNKEEKN